MVFIAVASIDRFGMLLNVFGVGDTPKILILRYLCFNLFISDDKLIFISFGLYENIKIQLGKFWLI